MKLNLFKVMFYAFSVLFGICIMGVPGSIEMGNYGGVFLCILIGIISFICINGYDILISQEKRRRHFHLK